MVMSKHFSMVKKLRLGKKHPIDDRSTFMNQRMAMTGVELSLWSKNPVEEYDWKSFFPWFQWSFLIPLLGGR